MKEYIVEKKQTSGGWTWAEPKGELIRCKDCKHYADECCDRYADETLGYVHSTQEYGYCWVAERKEE